MSRRRGEFEHRTSIFEGAFRAWSHLGGLEPELLESKPATELDPLASPIVNDSRLLSQKKGDMQYPSTNPDGSVRREYPYEPLPRSGLSHPYVQAILSPWLGPDADNEAIQLGLTTLRTWWQHRRKGESGSAVAALGTEKMKGVVEGYTRHFFTLAHCLIVNDQEQPPRTLHTKMKELEKHRSKKNKKRVREEQEAQKIQSIAMGSLNELGENPSDAHLTPLERLHAAQRRQLAQSGGLQTHIPGVNDLTATPLINIKGKCMPGKIDLPGVLDQVNVHATQFAHRGSGLGPVMNVNGNAIPNDLYGDPLTTPVVFVSPNGDLQIALSVQGITCAHCVKIVETVLRGCNGNKSPIQGLLDAAADRDLMSVLIRINSASNAKRIAFEASRNLAMVGYTAKVKEMSIIGSSADKKSTMDLGALATAFEVVASTDNKDIFDWTLPCTCPDNGVLRSDCSRHSQMNKRIFDSFEAREDQVKNYMAGCGMKYGMACTCGPDCRCKDCAVHNNGSGSNSSTSSITSLTHQISNGSHVSHQNGMGGGNSVSTNNTQMRGNDSHLHAFDTHSLDAFQPQVLGVLDEEPIQVDQKLNLFGMAPPPAVAAGMTTTGNSTASGSSYNNNNNGNINLSYSMDNDASLRLSFYGHDSALASIGNNTFSSSNKRASMRSAQRNPSVISYGNGLRHMSLTSETTFGRAMSGLSALSIDWENLEDFDLDVDHSAHINNVNPPYRSDVLKRSSLRRSGASDSSEPHVSFKV